jgi:predicted 3-demethylubiquinone-9 3-methyltransferase (glyoxalase superfamily)
MNAPQQQGGERRQRIVPNIWCNANAEEAGRFYAEAFERATAEVESRYPTEGLLEFQKPFAGEPLTVELTIDGYLFRLINAGDQFRPGPALSFMLNFDPLRFDGDEERARASLDRLWERLLDGGTALMPLAAYPFSAHYGWVQDRYGVNWQLMLTDPAGEPRPFVIPALMFDGLAQDRAAEAADFYTTLFASVLQDSGGTAIGTRFPYPAPSGKAAAGALAFGEFRLGDQWFVGNDNGSGVDHGFSCGVSLEVQCHGQEEIDFLWQALSAVPEAEQCGWLVDSFGVNWQIVPDNIAELMQRPGAFEHMLEMKKLVIPDF